MLASLLLFGALGHLQELGVGRLACLHWTLLTFNALLLSTYGICIHLSLRNLHYWLRLLTTDSPLAKEKLVRPDGLIGWPMNAWIALPQPTYLAYPIVPPFGQHDDACHRRRAMFYISTLSNNNRTSSLVVRLVSLGVGTPTLPTTPPIAGLGKQARCLVRAIAT